MNKYCTKLLYQYKVIVDGDAGQFRRCEESMILIEANDAKGAYAAAMEQGKANQLKYQNDEGNRVHKQFVGIMDMLRLGVECEDNEVWYNTRVMLRPMERKDKIIPKRRDLSAFVNEDRD